MSVNWFPMQVFFQSVHKVTKTPSNGRSAHQIEPVTVPVAGVTVGTGVSVAVGIEVGGNEAVSVRVNVGTGGSVSVAETVGVGVGASQAFVSGTLQTEKVITATRTAAEMIKIK